MPRKRSSSNNRPLASAAHFRVDWGGPAGSEGFLRVEVGPLSPDGGGELVLTRAVDGSRALVDWLQARRGRKKPVLRDILLTLADSSGAAVARYRFLEARPVLLRLSPFDATQGMIATESLTIGFAGFVLLD